MKFQTGNFYENKSFEKIQIWLKSGVGRGGGKHLKPYMKTLVCFISTGDIKWP
jgi:hypothetical protein